MKKLVYLIIMSLLLTLVPVDSAEAATKAVATPVVTSVYNKKLDDFKYKFTHSNKNAKIYYKDKDGTEGWKQVKNGATIKVSGLCKNNGIYIYAKVGKTKSKVRYCNLGTLDERLVEAKMKKEMNNIISKDDNKDMKFMKLLVYFKENYNYTLDYSYAGKRDVSETKTVFRRRGECKALANAFTLYCKVLGIKAETVTDSIVDYKYRNNHAWNHVYLDKYPILVDPTQVVVEGNSALYGYCSLDFNSYKKSKYQFTKSNVLRIQCVDYTKKISTDSLVIEYIVDSSSSNIKFTNNAITYTQYYYDELDEKVIDDYSVTFTYDNARNYWYGTWVDNRTGEVIEDDKAEVDAWYAAHPEVERS